MNYMSHIAAHCSADKTNHENERYINSINHNQ
jgi:hypothetical protein